MSKTNNKIESVPITYLPKELSKKDLAKQKRELIKSRKAYKKGEFYSRKKINSFKSKESPHLARVRKLYKVRYYRISI